MHSNNTPNTTSNTKKSNAQKKKHSFYPNTDTHGKKQLVTYQKTYSISSFHFSLLLYKNDTQPIKILRYLFFSIKIQLYLMSLIYLKNLI